MLLLSEVLLVFAPVLCAGCSTVRPAVLQVIVTLKLTCLPGFLSGGGGWGGAFAPPWNHFAPPWHSHIVNYKYCDREIGNGTGNFGCQIAPETV